MRQVIPPNVEVVNGHWLCFGEPDGSVSLFTPGEGYWGFWLPEQDARRTAQVVCGGVCIECGCEVRHHDNDAASCDKCGTCSGLVSERTRQHQNHWTTTEAKEAKDVHLALCIHGEPLNVFCGKCEP